ncbi:MAG: hypothetical protein JXB29_08355 [Sedimentisphaerales bacterium]|nr:hypothetical protein [Sedimentisphaerales bacterium]
MTQVWQIAAGEPGRNYTPLFIKHDVMFLGPGRYGPYSDDVYRALIDKRLWSGQKISTIRQFATKVKRGDIVLLRNGKQVLSIGVVAEKEYEYNETFDDVLGWDLQHTRRVIWQDLTCELKQIQNRSPLYGNIRGPMSMFTSVKKPQILNQIDHLFDRCRTRPLKPMPGKLPDPLTLEELGEELFSKGLSNKAVDKVILAIQRQRRLAKWYDEYGKESVRPREHEGVAHMILPLLLALGWSEQLLAVEWHKIDLAAFSGTPTTEENCCLVCEAKGLERALEGKVFDQAVKYADGLKPNNCKKILLTDGIRLYLYQRKENGKWKQSPDGYLNIRLIRTNHIAPADTNAVDIIMALTPAGINRVSINTEL